VVALNFGGFGGDPACHWDSRQKKVVCSARRACECRGHDTRRYWSTGGLTTRLCRVVRGTVDRVEHPRQEHSRSLQYSHDVAKAHPGESDRQHQRGIADLNLPESGFGSPFHEHRHVVANWIAVEQPVGLFDHLLDLHSSKGGKPISQSIDDLGDTLILL
jgi:hypothetical protein